MIMIDLKTSLGIQEYLGARGHLMEAIEEADKVSRMPWFHDALTDGFGMSETAPAMRGN